MPAGFWKHPTKVGTFAIRKMQGRWHALFEDESLGSYATPQKAADDLAGGHTFLPSSGVDPSRLGLTDDLAEWE
jgi:hypothetical protein